MARSPLSGEPAALRSGPRRPRAGPPGGRAAPATPRPRRGRCGAGRALAALTLALLAPGAAAAHGSALDRLLTLFAAHYAPTALVTQHARDLEFAAASHELALLPRFDLTESVNWREFSSLDLSLALSASVPLYRLRAEPEAALFAARRPSLAEFSAATAASARAEFVRDVLYLTLVTELETAAETALVEFERYWQPPSTLDEAFVLDPAERELLAVHQEVVALARFAMANADELRRRIERLHGVPLGAIDLPGFAELRSAVTVNPPTVAACLATAPESAAAAALRVQRTLERALDSTANVEVGLVAHVDYRGRLPYQAGAPADGAFGAGIGLQARIPLPDHWPVSGEVAGLVDPKGAEQTLRLSWPAALTTGAPGPSDGAQQDDRELADSTEYLTGRVTALLRAYESAARDVEAAELTLLWLARDYLPGVDGIEAARAAARTAAQDPVLAMHVVNARAALALAEAELAGAALELQIACGTGDLGAWPDAPGP